MTMADAPVKIKHDIDPVKPLPFDQAIKFWQQKTLRVSEDTFKGLSADAKVKALAVAGITKVEALTTIYDALGEALINGESFGTFKKRIKEQITAENWSKRKVAGIYRTNIQTAYNAGHWLRYREDGMEVLVYDAVGDRRTRPTHAALDGKAFRIDDPFWDTWMPPNGFGCRCTTQGMSAIEAEARGLVVGNGKDIINQSVVLPNGQPQALKPDPGFDNNPGKAMFGRYPEIPDQDLVAINQPNQNLKDVRPADLIPWESVKPESIDLLPNDLSEPELRKLLSAQMGDANGFVDGVGDLVIYDERPFVGHHYSHKEDARERRQWAGLVRDVMDHPHEVNIVGRPLQEKRNPKRKDDRTRIQKRYLKRFALPDGSTKTLVVVTSWRDTHWQPITWYPTTDKRADNLRGGGSLLKAHK